MMRLFPVARSIWPKAVLSMGVCLLGAMFVGCLPGALDPSLIGGHDGGGTGGGGGGGLDPCVAKVFEMKFCIACHYPDNGMTGVGLDLMTPGIKARLLDKPPSMVNGNLCGATTTPLLVSGPPPARGLFIDKIQREGTVPGLCGNTMPQAAFGVLSDADRTCLQNWANQIANGADIGP